AATPKPPRTRPWRRLWAPLTTAAVVLVGLTIWATSVFFPMQVIATSVGKQRTVKLQDRSVVELSARSRIEVRFTRTGREVCLIDGEALFRVERDTQQPAR